MRAARRGDSAAYARLLTEIAAVLRRYVRVRLARSVRAGLEVEDIVQETLIGLHLKRDSWDDTRPIRPWVHAIARYKVADALRRAARDVPRHDLPIDAWAEVIAAPGSEPPHRERDAERLIAALPRRDRGLVRALALEGLSIRSAAERFAMTEGAVRVALHRARQRLGRMAEAQRT
jgi:RNA polymerase sigma-70 factor (ECF subfamily)